jgi:hypothetical protein
MSLLFIVSRGIWPCPMGLQAFGHRWRATG